jgi:outer membrane protein TolC
MSPSQIPNTILVAAMLAMTAPQRCHAASPGPALELSWVISQVRSKDPALASARAEASAASQSALAAYAWAPPQLGLELMGLDAANPDLSNSMQRKWSLTQELPFPGRTWGQGRVASHLSEARQADADLMAQQEFRAAREAFYGLAAADYLLEALERVSQATKEMAQASKRRSSFGQLDRMGQFMDSMLAMEDSAVLGLIPLARQQRRSAEAALQRLMGADPTQPLAHPDLDPSALPAKALPELEGAWREAKQRSPALRSAGATLAAAEAARSLALSGWLPDLMAQGSVTEDGTGNRQGGAMLGLSLPWLWFWKQAGEAGAAKAEEDKARKDLDAAGSALKEQLADAIGNLQAINQSLGITLDKTLPQAAKGLEQARSGFRTTALGPSEILMAVQDYRMTEENVAQLIAQWGAARALLDMLIANGEEAS